MDSKNKIKIGLDIHGVIDSNINFFKILTKLLVDNGHEVHIITGAKIENELPFLKENTISYTHLFSITDYHIEKGTEITWDEKNNPHLETYAWDKAKAEYCKKENIDIHFDDSDIYNYFFKTPYARYFAKDTKKTEKLHL
jgi:hypothetical protein